MTHENLRSAPSVIVLRGLPGSGKSTLAAKYQAAGAVVCSADHFFYDAQGNYKHEGSKVGLAHNACFRKFLNALDIRADVIVVDNTNTHPVEIAPYMLAASTYGYDAEVVEIPCDVETSIARNTHQTPPAVIREMAENLATQILPPYWPVRCMQAE